LRSDNFSKLSFSSETEHGTIFSIDSELSDMENLDRSEERER